MKQVIKEKNFVNSWREFFLATNSRINVKSKMAGNIH
jgi:hypothetical protein